VSPHQKLQSHTADESMIATVGTSVVDVVADVLGTKVLDSSPKGYPMPHSSKKIQSRHNLPPVPPRVSPRQKLQSHTADKSMIATVGTSVVDVVADVLGSKKLDSSPKGYPMPHSSKKVQSHHNVPPVPPHMSPRQILQSHTADESMIAAVSTSVVDVVADVLGSKVLDSSPKGGKVDVAHVDAGEMDSSAKASEADVPIDIKVDMGSLGSDTKADGKHDGSMANSVITIDESLFPPQPILLSYPFPFVAGSSIDEACKTYLCAILVKLLVML
jgi:hypothetical protein